MKFLFVCFILLILATSVMGDVPKLIGFTWSYPFDTSDTGGFKIYEDNVLMSDIDNRDARQWTGLRRFAATGDKCGEILSFTLTAYGRSDNTDESDHTPSVRVRVNCVTGFFDSVDGTPVINNVISF